MTFRYQVILRPTDVKFSCQRVADKFNNGYKLKELVQDISNGNIKTKDIPSIQVVWDCNKWEWFTINNRRLWVFQELERLSKLTYVAMYRVENEKIQGIKTFDSVTLFTPDWDIQTINSQQKLFETNTKQTVTIKFTKEETLISSEKQTTLETQSNTTEMSITEKTSTEANKVKDTIHVIDLTNIEDEDNMIMPNDNDMNNEIDLTNNVKMEEDTNDEQTKQIDKETAAEPQPGEMTYDVPLPSIVQPTTVQALQELPNTEATLTAEVTNTVRPVLQTVTALKDKISSVVKIVNKEFNKIQDPRGDSRAEQMFSDMNELSPCTSVRKRSISSSTTSLAHSTSSMLSRNERKLSEDSGLFGYGYFHMYKTQYLDKVRSARESYLRNLKPYDVKSAHSSRSSRYSSTSSLSNLKSISYHSSRDDISSHRSSRYSLDDFTNLSRSENRKRNSAYSSNKDYFRERTYSTRHEKSTSNVLIPVCDSLVPYVESQKALEKNSGVKFSAMYALWQKRREEFIKTHGRRAIQQYNSSPDYLCGICFKKFKTIVDLQQHSEALMHYACVTCGKFFSSYASLGQHCQKYLHKKD